MPTISAHDALPEGYRLGEFEILHVLGIGGFGIVYLAMDHALQRQVAIKEYMPASLSARGLASEVIVRSASHAETFALGLRSFINEARLLARFDHPSLVKVYRFWEAHGTAYMVMPYYQGQTLQQVRRTMAQPPDEAWLRRLIMPLLGALECLHRENVFHRDVAPDNIMLLDDGAGALNGRPVLLDLGAARRVIGDHTHALTAIVKPSFAPIEQYAETAQLRQGPWTDLYALAAVVHYCITGRPPMPATARAVHDELPLLRQMGPGLASGFDCHFSEPFIHAMDAALAVRPQDRPASVGAWRSALSGLAGSLLDAQPDTPQMAASGEDWTSHTVLVRPASGETPPGHLAIEAEAFKTTVPAAGKLSAPPAWSPQPEAPESAPESEPDAGEPAPPQDAVPAAPARPAHPHGELMPTTMPVHRPVHAPVTEDAGRATHEPAMARQALPGLAHADADAAASRERWSLKWAFVGLALMTVLAVWWQQRHGPKTSAVPHPSSVMAAEPAADKQGDKPVERTVDARAKLVPADVVQAHAEDEPGPRKHRRPVKAERVSTLQSDEARAADIQDTPLNPRRACSGKSFIMLAICMKRHCSRPEYTAHAECERMRQQEAAQRNGNNNY